VGNILTKVQDQFREEFDKITVTQGKTHHFLGMDFDFTTEGRVIISQPNFIDKILSDYPEIRPEDQEKEPAKANLFAIDENSTLLLESEREKFHSTTASLLYLAVKTRKELSCAVSFLTSRVKVATKQDQTKLDVVLKYLNGTKDLGLILGGDNDGKMNAHLFTDASYGIHLNGKSHTGICLKFQRGSVTAKSIKQKVVSKSTAEAELIAQSDGVALGSWALQFLEEQGYILPKVIVYEDNKATITLAQKGSPTSERSRHIRIRFFFIKQFIDSKEMELIYCPTEDMIADILTKPLSGELFRKLRDYLLGYTPY
jgi:hypothetical protein